MADKAWSDLESFGNTILLFETETPDLTLLKTLANEGLNVISDAVKNVYRSWSNAQGGGLTIVTNTVQLPTDMSKLSTVYWDGKEIHPSSEAGEDNAADDWRTRTGDPSAFVRTGRSIILDSVPQGTVTGKLVMWGYGTLPQFSATQGAENPLLSFPSTHQLAPVYYALANYPADPQSGLSSARKADYIAKWERSLAACVEAMNTLKREPFSYQ
jgi:hypothetical protein